MAERCVECGQRTTLPVFCKPCRVAFADVSPETCPWPEEAPYVAPVPSVTRWAVPVPYVPTVTDDDYSEQEETR